MPKAGENIRKMADNRQKAAKQKFIQTGFLIITPLVIAFLSPLSLVIKALICFVSGVCAYFSYLEGKQLLIKANQATQGAIGEETVAKILQPLNQQGWKIEYNIRLKHWGDADVFLSSPQGNHFVIDTKSNKGGIFLDGSVLKRRYGKKVYEISEGKDILKAVTGQAASLKKLKKVTFVQPILCFTRANLEEIDQHQKIKGVYVVSSVYLVEILQKLNLSNK